MRGTLACCLLAVVVAGAAFGQSANVPVRPTLTYTEGQVTIDGKDASIGDAVPLGATIVTAAQSVAEIEFSGLNIIQLGEGTTFIFNPNNLQLGSELKKGTLALVLKKIATVSGGPAFTVRTPSAVCGVRGTTFFVNALDPSTTYVCSCNGDVHVEDLSGGSVHDMVAAHHKAYLFTTTASGATVTDSTLLYHSDESMDALAAKIGVKIDWTTPDG